MKIVVMYRPKSEHARVVETFLQDYKHRYADAKLEVVDVDSREGSALASLYDIVQYPAIMALAVDGSPQNIWQGEALPLIDEVAAYSQGDDVFARDTDSTL